MFPDPMHADASHANASRTDPSGARSVPRSVLVAFTLSGVAGLVYEVVWSRYLALYVGHGAFAQVLVLAVYLGGMALGALAVADQTRRIRRPLLWYGWAEGALALSGVLFHPLYRAVTGWSYDAAFPALADASLVGAARWGIAALLILPQAMVLGATFPLMAASLVRGNVALPGQSIARAYLLNTLGGAAGVLLAGFWLIGAFGLPGTLIAAALLNAGAAFLAFSAGGASAEATAPVDALPPESIPESTETGTTPSPTPSAAARVILPVAVGTALASFAYEVGWIRMLSLSLGSATHAFELMLSAFLLGLGLGAWIIQRRADGIADPFRRLGSIQVAMGVAALGSLLLYRVTFEAVGALVGALSGAPAGYLLLNLGRYALSLLVMLPATVLAGMTLPLLAGSLLRAGAGERAIGRVYGLNTLGSVVGAAFAGLVALPLLGLKGLIVGGALLDISLGLWLFERSARWRGRGLHTLLAPAGIAAAAVALALLLTPFDEILLSSGVYRLGEIPEEGERQLLYHADGRTATVSAYVGTSDGVTVLATNGKPDASLDPLWKVEGRDTLPERPIAPGRDITTQILAPIVTLAHNPGARTAVNVGHGSGMTATSLLTSDRIERVVTVEIEPLMVEGSLVFLPANGPTFADPRSTFVFDDAKSFLSYRRERFDLLFAEPSNPWVSGTSALFTREFYERAAASLAPGGVLGQWVQLYELDDDLLLTILSALDQVFPSYRAYLVGDSDLAIVARKDGPLPPADWSVVASDRFRQLMAGVPPFRPEQMEALLVFDERTFRSVLEEGIEANSDFHPILDLGAERARFEQAVAEGALSFALNPVDLHRLVTGEAMRPHPYAPVPAYGLTPALLWARGAWLREAVRAGGATTPEWFPDWEESLLHLHTFLALSSTDHQLGSWETWAQGFDRAASELHWGTTGWADTVFFGAAERFLDRAEAPPAARAAVALHRALAEQDWGGVAGAADQLVTRVAAGERWVLPTVLLDASTIGYLRSGRTDAARHAFTVLVPRTGRASWNLRNRLLGALIRDAEATGDGS